MNMRHLRRPLDVIRRQMPFPTSHLPYTLRHAQEGFAFTQCIFNTNSFCHVASQRKGQPIAVSLKGADSHFDWKFAAILATMPGVERHDARVVQLREDIA